MAAPGGHRRQIRDQAAATAEIEAPFHCLVYGKDGALSYVIRRFDRTTQAPGRIPVEDFAQLERSRLLRRVLFSFLVGNEDMHLKNYSLIRRAGKVELSPAYDLLNTTLVLGPDAEESALPVAGKKRGLTKRLFVDYLGRERCGLPEAEIAAILHDLRSSIPCWKETIGASFLSLPTRKGYMAILQERTEQLLG